MPLRPKTERIVYNDAGTLEGHVNGKQVKVRHSKPGPSGFEVFWNERWYSWLYAGLVEEEFGIEVHTKKKGCKKDTLLKLLYGLSGGIS